MAQIAEIKEDENEEQDEDGKEGEEFNVRKYLDTQCERMLKIIQKKDKEAFLDVFQDYPEDLEE